MKTEIIVLIASVIVLVISVGVLLRSERERDEWIVRSFQPGFDPEDDQPPSRLIWRISWGTLLASVWFTFWAASRLLGL